MEAINQEGIIEITRIENQGGTDLQGTLTAKFVRYPGSQQLTVWLPENAWNGYGIYTITELNKKSKPTYRKAMTKGTNLDKLAADFIERNFKIK